jgi:hypothetical protein
MVVVSRDRVDSQLGRCGRSDESCEFFGQTTVGQVSRDDEGLESRMSRGDLAEGLRQAFAGPDFGRLGIAGSRAEVGVCEMCKTDGQLHRSWAEGEYRVDRACADVPSVDPPSSRPGNEHGSADLVNPKSPILVGASDP